MTSAAFEIDHAYRRCEKITRQEAGNAYTGFVSFRETSGTR
jgi:hypothetical protein